MYGDPDYEHVHQELKKVGVTLKLLHEEYIERCKRNGEIPMGKTKFNEGYAEFTITNRLTNHLEQQARRTCEVELVRPDHALCGYKHRGTDHSLSVCWNTSLQPVFLC